MRTLRIQLDVIKLLPKKKVVDKRIQMKPIKKSQNTEELWIPSLLMKLQLSKLKEQVLTNAN